MMKVLSKFFLIGLFSCLSISLIHAQEGLSERKRAQFNVNSVDPIADYEQLYKQRIWIRMDLAQKQNKGFFLKNSEFSKVIIDAVKNDDIQNIYWEDSLTRMMTKEEFIKKLNREEELEGGADEQDPYDPDFLYYEGDPVSYNGVDYISLKDDNLNQTPGSSPDFWDIYAGEAASVYFPSEITWIEIMEDVIFDKRRGRQYHDILSIKLIVPGAYSNDGSNVPIACFSYKDLEKFFRENPKKAIWFNQQNSAENRNLADAFLLRLFHGELYKVENPDDLTIMSMYDGSKKEGIMASKWLENSIMEREHNLWEY